MAYRFISLLLAALMIALGVALLFFVIARVPVVPERSLVTWIDSDYQPGTFCPGDLVKEIVTVKAEEQASVVVISTFSRGGNAGDAVQPARLGDAAVVNIASARMIEDSDPVWVVPDFPPGDYVRVVAAGTIFRNTEPIFRTQPFTITEDCNAVDP